MLLLFSFHVFLALLIVFAFFRAYFSFLQLFLNVLSPITSSLESLELVTMRSFRSRTRGHREGGRERSSAGGSGPAQAAEAARRHLVPAESAVALPATPCVRLRSRCPLEDSGSALGPSFPAGVRCGPGRAGSSPVRGAPKAPAVQAPQAASSVSPRAARRRVLAVGKPGFSPRRTRGGASSGPGQGLAPPRGRALGGASEPHPAGSTGAAALRLHSGLQCVRTSVGSQNSSS